MNKSEYLGRFQSIKKWQREPGAPHWQRRRWPQPKLLCRICQTVFLNSSFNIKAKIVFINEKDSFDKDPFVEIFF